MKYFQYLAKTDYSIEDFDVETLKEKNMTQNFEQCIMKICGNSISNHEKFQRRREYLKKNNRDKRG